MVLCSAQNRTAPMREHADYRVSGLAKSGVSGHASFAENVPTEWMIGSGREVALRKSAHHWLREKHGPP